MNMFKRGRKAKDQEWLDSLPSPNGTKTPKVSWRRGKNAVIDEKPTLDLENALPDTGDFRTSLIMPGLSARFSMLREQDDPNSKIGKASDDSVLFPKRASRLNLFGHTTFALTDIAEVESIRTSIKPPFADRERASSIGDGYESDSGSMMTRSRPGEGNNLFGGRQKLYRIPTTSTRTLTEGEKGAVGGKHMYESDVSLSLFQQYRQKEREANLRDDDIHRRSRDDDHDATQSPTLGHDMSQKRGTQSSTASAASNLRASTAATSVASDSPAYQLGGYSATSTTDNGSMTSPTLRKLREEPFKPMRQLSESKSAANIREKYRPAALHATGILKPGAPASAGAVQPLDFGFGDAKANLNATRRGGSPIDGNSVLASSVRANDRGKATAMGLFNKPAREFDEQQYLQRQLQMHEGRSSPFNTTSRSQSRASSEAQRTQRNDSTARVTPSPAPSEQSNAPRMPPIPAMSSSPPRNAERTSKMSVASSGGRQTPPTRPRSKSSASTTAKDNVKARVESLIRRQNAELAMLESQNLVSNRPREHSQSTHTDKDVGSSFLDDDDDDDFSMDDSRRSGARQSTTDSLPLPNTDIHPAFRTSFAASTTSSFYSKTRSMIDENKDEGRGGREHVISVDSDTLGVQPSIGLSGLIRSHLRHDSDKSIGLPPLSPLPGSGSIRDSAPRSPGMMDKALLAPGQITPGPPTPTTAISQRAQQMLSHAMALKAAAGDASPSTPADDASDYEDGEGRNGRYTSHQRGDSSATTKERREFDEDLAERRRRIREGLKSVVEGDPSLSSTPPKGREYTMQAFAQPEDSFVLDAQTRDRRRRQPASGGSQSVVEPDQYRYEENHRRDNNPPPTSFGSTKQRSSPEQHARTGRRTPSQTRDQATYRYGNDTNSRTSPGAGLYGRSRSTSSAADRSRNYTPVQNQTSPPAAVPGSLRYSPTDADSPTVYDYNASTSPQEFRGRTVATVNMQRHAMSPPSRPEPQMFNPRSPPGSGATVPISHLQHQQQPASNVAAASSIRGRSASRSGRKRSGTKTQISEPTFISSTSSISLVPLPQNVEGQQIPPPLPEMNPRRRGNTSSEKQPLTLNLAMSNSVRLPLETVPASPRLPDQDARPSLDESSKKRQRRKLRKSSSEGGNLAAKARQQALLAEINREKALAPKGPMFPNRSATALGLGHDGNMF